MKPAKNDAAKGDLITFCAQQMEWDRTACWAGIGRLEREFPNALPYWGRWTRKLTANEWQAVKEAIMHGALPEDINWAKSMVAKVVFIFAVLLACVGVSEQSFVACLMALLLAGVAALVVRGTRIRKDIVDNMHKIVTMVYEYGYRDSGL